MSLRLFVAPLARGTGNRSGRHGVKYVSDGTNRFAWEDRTPRVRGNGGRIHVPGWDFRWCLAEWNLTRAEADTLDEQPDVIMFPRDLTRELTAARRSELRDLFTLVDIPINLRAAATWLDLADDIRDLVPTLQRYCGLHHEPLTGPTRQRLDDPLPARTRTRLADVYRDRDLTVIPGTTLRENMDSCRAETRRKRLAR